MDRIFSFAQKPNQNSLGTEHLLDLKGAGKLSLINKTATFTNGLVYKRMKSRHLINLINCLKTISTFHLHWRRIWTIIQTEYSILDQRKFNGI